MNFDVTYSTYLVPAFIELGDPIETSLVELGDPIETSLVELGAPIETSHPKVTRLESRIKVLEKNFKLDDVIKENVNKIFDIAKKFRSKSTKKALLPTNAGIATLMLDKLNPFNVSRFMARRTMTSKLKNEEDFSSLIEKRRTDLKKIFKGKKIAFRKIFDEEFKERALELLQAMDLENKKRASEAIFSGETLNEAKTQKRLRNTPL